MYGPFDNHSVTRGLDKGGAEMIFTVNYGGSKTIYGEN